MPEISRFFGIIIYIYYKDHPEPHFHAEYAGKMVKIRISDLAVIDGSISSQALKMVLEWAAMYQKELKKAWSQAMARQIIDKIPPLE